MIVEWALMLYMVGTDARKSMPPLYPTEAACNDAKKLYDNIPTVTAKCFPIEEPR